MNHSVESFEIVKEYVLGWIKHDPQRIVNTFAENGVYIDPLLNRELSRDQVAEHACNYFSLFPDLRFDPVGPIIKNDDGLIAAQWVMHGTNTTGSQRQDLTPISIQIPGADFLLIENKKIKSVQVYYDHRKIPSKIKISFSHKDSPLTDTTANDRYAKSALSREKSGMIKADLLRLLDEESLFLDSNISLSMLAKALRQSNNHVSQVINSEFGMNFHELINHYRIEAAMDLLKETSRQGRSILEVSFEVGFNSKSTFNAAFKKHTGITPTQFLQCQLRG